jgi:hypothetical protein
VAACSAGVAAAASGPNVRVRPKIGGRRTHFVVSFPAPQASGIVAGSYRTYEIHASTTHRRGCIASTTVPAGPTRQGQRVHVTLAPNGRWCRGAYSGEVQERTEPACGFLKVCPLARDVEPSFVAASVIGRFSYRVG